MYLVMLSPNDTQFVDAIDRTFPRFRTKALDRVVLALNQAKAQPANGDNLRVLLEAMNDWRAKEPREFANRGGTNGVAYRLWMEAKQRLANKFRRWYPLQDPPMPPNCPGDTLLGVYVPPDDTPQMEICHAFSYRWLLASGRLDETHPATGAAYNGPNMEGILFPGGRAAYPPVRALGNVAVQAGDLVGIFATDNREPLQFAHSLIVVDQTHWFGANNAGCFGLATGRTEVDFADQPKILNTGWQGNGNLWKRPTGGADMEMFYRRIIH